MKKILLLLTITLLLSSICYAKDTDLNTIILNIEKTSSQLNTLTANITQTDFTYDFNETDEVSGKIYYKKPNSVFWDVTQPEEMKILLKQNNISMYLPDINQVQGYELDKGSFSKYMPIGLGNSTNSLKDIYNISLVEKKDNLYHLSLEPKTKNEDFSNVEIWVDNKNWFPIKSKIFYLNNNTTSITFSNLKLNSKISDKKFQLNLPDDVELVEY